MATGCGHFGVTNNARLIANWNIKSFGGLAADGATIDERGINK